MQMYKNNNNVSLTFDVFEMRVLYAIFHVKQVPNITKNEKYNL